MMNGATPLSADIRAVLDKVPANIFLVDRDVRILDCNATARSLIQREGPAAPPRLCGAALGCVNALHAPGGCGTSPVCPDCVIRKAITAAADGTVVLRKQAHMRLALNDDTHAVFFLVTVHPIELDGRQLALMTLEDVSEAAELRGLLPICASCKRIRDDAGFWEQIEGYLLRHSRLEFTHGICPDCLKKLYPGTADHVA